MNSLLVLTNGNETTWPSIQFSVWMSSQLNIPLTLVGILENRGENDAVEEIFSRAVTLLQQKGISYTLQLETGQAEAIIPRKAANEAADLIVTGPLGRPPLLQFFSGHSFRHILAEVEKPLLYVPAAKIPVQKILVCLGGLGYGLTAESMGVQMARSFGASLTLLTVVPPIDLDYPEARAIRENWQNLADTDTLPGRTLRQAMETARKAQVKAQVITRQGNAIEEIRAEMRAGGYDMICMGSPYSSHSLRQMATANVTADIAETAPCPILSARYLGT